MNTVPIAVSAAGLLTSVGLDLASSCAALRCRLNNFRETGAVDYDSEPLVGARVPFGDQQAPDAVRLAQMAHAAMMEALSGHPYLDTVELPLLLCLAEPGRQGRIPDLESAFKAGLEVQLGHVLHAESQVIAAGRTSVALALMKAQDMLAATEHTAVMIVAADSLLNRASVAGHLREERLLATALRAGFISGEAAGALLITRADAMKDVELVVFANHYSLDRSIRCGDLPMVADGMTSAVTCALAQACAAIEDLAICVSDANGEDYYFEELALAQQRTELEAELWLPAESLGETGSAVGCVQLGWLMEARRKLYIPGNSALLLASDEEGRRTATIVAFQYSAHYEAVARKHNTKNDSLTHGEHNGT